MRASCLSILVLGAGLGLNLPAFANSPSQPGALPDDAYPGGTTTWLKKTGRSAFTHPSANMAFEKRMDFKLGEALFQRMWVAAPTKTHTTDGLGPLYNSRSCIGCHVRNGRGHALDPQNDTDRASVAMLLRLSIPPQNETDRAHLASGRVNSIPDPVYGNQFQELSVPGIPAEGRVLVTYQDQTIRLADGETITLRKPDYAFDELAYGPLHDGLMISPRIAPQLIGLGLLEAIPEDMITAQADPDDANGDGISGKANRVWNIATQKVDLGRFGWKAGMPTLDQQNQNAMQFDVGLSTPLYPEGAGDCTPAQTLCRAAPNGNDPQYDNLEAHGTITDLILYYTRHLAPPMRANANAPDILAGRQVFNDIGCASCHRASYQLPVNDQQPELSGQLIWPYSDLLLHDMGDGLADHRPEALATGSEWRTPPLWGLGRTKEIDSRAGFLHDGRANTILEAVLWHGGEAQNARDAVIALPKTDRNKLITFLKSL
ncbi:thiol oxidoreductase [Thalassospira profundimaris]|uniref:Thiol oxidoreductase n=1 Tax=Thalassospira profundimaris TaxID=502049 RepID=A0A367WSN3_9PROT|nr:thiol oxidoreductase [Thalassospira profundimaris]